MGNIAKQAIKKSRDRFLSVVLASLSGVHAKLDMLLSQTNDACHEQSEANARLHVQSTELREHVVNSGTLRISDKEIIAKTFSGLKIYLDPNDISVTPHLAMDSIWEYHITRAWLTVINRNDVVIDIGANFGYFGALAAQKTDKKKSKVVFFEANPALVPYINKTLSVNWLNEQSVVENLAVADKAGKVTLNILKDYIGSSSLHTSKHIDAYMHGKMRVETDSTVDIEAVTIDDYCDRQKIEAVNLIKMDIEGYEDKAYAGMRKVIKRSPNAILFIEFTRESYEDPKKFYETMLADFGFVYLIDARGQLNLQSNTGYEDVIGNPDDWIMPVFSKRADLAET